VETRVLLDKSARASGERLGRRGKTSRRREKRPTDARSFECYTFSRIPCMSSSGAGEIEIPNRALFKAAEVCELLKVQPYVLKSWESEFQDLGVAKTAGGPRVYRRADVEQVLRIKHLLLVEGLTLAGARRKIEEESAPIAVDEPVLDELIGRNARERLTEVKRGLRTILELLSSAPASPEFRLTAQAASRPISREVERAASKSPARSARGKPGPSAPPSPKRKRSA
jgi:DNA-binding transcriptional MerR regulator